MGPQWDRDERCYTPGPGGESSPGLSMVSNPRSGELRALVVPLEKEPRVRKVDLAAGGGEKIYEIQHSDFRTEYQDDEKGRQEGTQLTRLQCAREILRCLLSVGLLVGEAAAWLSLLGQLGGEGSTYTLLFLLTPTLLSSLLWLATSLGGRSCASTCSTFLLLLFSLPSPLLLHLANLYEVGRRRQPPRPLKRILAQAMLCHALTGSLPLFLTGLNILKQEIVTAEETIAVDQLHSFLSSHPLFIPALVLSFLLMVVGVHRFNEMRSSSLMAVLVSLPLTMCTLAARLIALTFILAFQPLRYSLLLLLLLTVGNLATGLCCRVGTRSPGARREEEEEGGVPAAVDCLGMRGSALLSQLPGQAIRAAASILHPLGYTSDPVLGHVRVRGGALLLANYLVVMAGLGAGLALSLLHRVPNTYQGLEMASIGVQLEVPETEVLVKSMSGMDIKVKMPITRMDLGGMESMQATVNMDPWLDKVIAIAAPLLLVLITLPATIVRAALLGLDCVVLRREVSEDESGSLQRARQGLGHRVSAALVCGLLGAIVTSLIVIATVAGVAAKLAS